MIKKLLIIFITFFAILNTTQADNSGAIVSSLSIKELSNQVEKLKEEKTVFEEKTKVLSKDYGELIDFIKKDLTKEETQDIKEKIYSYRDDIKDLQNDLVENIKAEKNTDDIKKEILDKKINLYKYLGKFIDITKKDDFFDYINFDIQSVKERKDLIEEIVKNEYLLNQKVNYIKTQIVAHKETLQNQLETTIAQKITKKIDEIDSKDKYANIDTNKKNAIYNDFIDQLQEKINQLENSNLSDNYKTLRKNILEKIIIEVQNKIN